MLPNPAPMALVETYQPFLVIASLVTAVFASYTALDLSSRVITSTGRHRRWWLIGGSMAMGTGIWGMHFAGMLAFQLPIQTHYHIPTVIASYLAAVGASAIALFFICQEQVTKQHWILASLSMGAGIGAMHYTGMFAMRFQATLDHKPTYLLLSVAIAVVVALVALRLFIKFGFISYAFWSWEKFGAALLMGGAIAGLHYTAMAGARFTTAPHLIENVSWSIDIEMISGTGLVVSTFLILGLTLLTSIADRTFALNAHELTRTNQALAEARDQALEAAHGLKGIARNMSADTLAHLAANMETLCKAGTPEALAPFRQHLRAAFNQTNQILQQVITDP